jgi:DNA-binding CsgD family transcriptional regulator
MKQAPLAARERDPGAAPGPSLDDLTPRQRQIVELLRAGKVNKEIARELGIGVGTVKQHVVTLFRRLNVSNRTMAVMALAGQASPPGAAPAPAAPAPAAAAMERRPCVLLSLGVPAGAGEAALRRLHGVLAALACDSDAVFLARRGQAGDLIFGLHQVGEGDLQSAVASARRLHAELQAALPELAAGLRGGMTVGEVVASMLRQGGWSGEAVASTALADARALQEQATPGQLLLGRPILALMQALGIRGEAWFGAGPAPGAVAFGDLDGIDWRNDRHIYPLVGRTQQRAALAGLLHGAAQLVLLEAETGMGKSRLCAEALELWRAAGRPAGLCRIAPHPAAHGAGRQDDCSAALALLKGTAAPALAVVDDCHLLAPAARQALLAAARAAVQGGAVVLLAGRPMAEMAALQPGHGVLRLALPRLAASETAALAAQVLAAQRTGEGSDGAGAADAPGLPLAAAAPGPSAGAGPGALASGAPQQIAAEAAGVPLFAVELARHRQQPGMAISLLATVCARLDGLHLDRKLLRTAARAAAPTVAGLAAAMDEDEADVAALVQRAQAAGVLRATPAGTLEFGHPLLRKIIDYLCVE